MNGVRQRIPLIGVGIALALGIANIPGAAASNAVDRCLTDPPERAVGSCRIAVEERPADAELHVRLARGLIARGDHEPAIDAFRVAANNPPHDADVHAELAGVLMSLRRYVEAAEPIEVALHLRPGDVRLLRMAAATYRRSGRIADMIEMTGTAAGLGDRESMYVLSGYLKDGHGVAADPGAAYDWMRRAAEAGHPGALAAMVRIHREGDLGRPRDESAATEWARRERAARTAREPGGRTRP
jgi:TPR repeat protein